MKRIFSFFMIVLSILILGGCNSQPVELGEIQQTINELESRIEEIENVNNNLSDEDLALINQSLLDINERLVNIEDNSDSTIIDEFESINLQLAEVLELIGTIDSIDSGQDENIIVLNNQLEILSTMIETLEVTISQIEQDQVDLLNNDIATIETNIVDINDRLDNLSGILELLISSKSSEYLLTDEEVNIYLSTLSSKIDLVSTDLFSGYNFNGDYVNNCEDNTNNYDVCFNVENYPNIYTDHFYDGIKKIRDLDIVKLLVSESWNNIGRFDSVPMIVGQELSSGDSFFKLDGRNSTSAVFTLGVSGEASSIGGAFDMKLAIYKDIETNIITVEVLYNIEANYSFLSVDFSSFKFKIDFNEMSEIQNMLLYKSYVSGFKENITIYTPTETGIDIHYMSDTPGYFNKEYFNFEQNSLRYLRYSDTTLLDPVFEYEEFDTNGLVWSYGYKDGEGDTHLVPLNRFSNWTYIGYDNQVFGYRIDIQLDDETSIYLEDDVWSNTDDGSVIKIDEYNAGVITLSDTGNYIFETINDIFVFYGDADGNIEQSTYYKGFELDSYVTNSILYMIDSEFESPNYFDFYVYNGITVFSEVNLNLDDFNFGLND